MNRIPLVFAALLTALVAIPAAADDHEATRAKIEAAMASDIRPERDVARDANRLPLETLEFFGLRDDMTVVELLPGGGWYTRILSPVLDENGRFYIAYGGTRMEEELSGTEGFENMRRAAADAKVYRPEGSRYYVLENADLGVTGADMVLTFRNYHNFNAEGRAAMNEAAFDALKSGGIYAVVDHTRRHMQANDNENGRRFDPVLAIKEIQAAGFEFVDFSDLHYRPDDELRYEVGRRSVTGNTDRFSLKFVKP
ncbi:class I SAM-dependent methyltransferase [Elongatibacter sediminis]|uniref:Methyltransferase n=1 Tax=Elongatibacter sediminis TaxID=3119006 RepID=A0AAW9REZ9_9GAMM